MNQNPYYQNWSYGYTLQPSTEQSRGAYNVQYPGGHQHQQGGHQHHQGAGGHHHQAQGVNNWAQIKGQQPQSAPKAQVFVTAAPVKTEPAESSLMPPPATPVTIKAEPSTGDTDPPSMALLKLHELAVANKLVERYEKVEDEKNATAGSQKQLKVVLFLGNEIYQGSGINIKAAKQQAAAQALQNTKYQSKAEKIASIPTMTPRKIGVTATSELYEWSTKKGVYVDFKFLEPYNFEFKHSMRMWDKKEMIGNYRVQLNVAGYEFYGNAELPQQAKHNAAVQALPIVRNLPDPIGTAAVVSQPGGAPAPGAAGTESSGGANPTSATCGSGQGYEKNVNMALNEIAMRNGCVPEWTMVSESGPQHQKRFTWQLNLGNFTTCGTGHSKKIAKQTAAEEMMNTLPDEWKKGPVRSNNRRGGVNKFGTQRKRPAGAAQPQAPPESKKKKEDDGKIVITADNPVSCLYEFCKKKKIPDPDFDCISENLLETWQRGSQTMKKIAYTIQLKVDGKTYLAESNTKKAAKQACAAEAWNSIRATLL